MKGQRLLNMKNKVLLAALLGAVMGMMLFGCGHGDSDVSSEKKVTEESRVAEETEEEEQKAEEDSEKAAGKETKYEETFVKAVQIDGKKEKVQVLQNTEDVTDTKIMVTIRDMVTRGNVPHQGSPVEGFTDAGPVVP